MASTPDLEDLLARFFDGSLDPEGEQRLDALLSADPDAFERFKGLLGIEGLLRAREGDVDVLPGRVLETLRAEGPRRRFTHRVMESIHHRKSTSRWRREQRLAWIAAAAVLLVAVLAAAFLRPSRPVEPRNEDVRVSPPAPLRAELPPPSPPPAPAGTKQPDSFVPAPPPRPPEPPAPPPPAPPAVETPAPAPPVPAPPKAEPAPTTIEKRALAVLRAPTGDVRIPQGPARDGVPLAAGEGVETGAGTAVLEFADGTRLELGESTEVRELADREGGRKPRGLRLTVVRGTVSATVAKQPAELPFTLASAAAEARVLGTSLRFTVEPGAKGRAALEVSEGKVRLVRTRDGKAVEVGPGQMAVAGPEGELAAKALLVDEILLAAREARLTGAEWKLVADPRASGGASLEAQKTPHKATDHVETRMAYATFLFWARADREYTLWVRAHSQGTGDPWTRDFLTVHPQDCKLSHPSPFFGTAPTTGYVFNGLGAVSTYGWVSGSTEEGRAEGPPLRVKFNRTGFQTLRLLVDHPGIRVDAVWLSASQLSKPGPRVFPKAE